MNKKSMFLALALMLMSVVGLANDKHFTTSVTAYEGADRQLMIDLSVTIKKGTYIYDDSVTVEVKDAKTAFKSGDPTVDHEGYKVYMKDFVRTYVVTGAKEGPLTVTVGYQGCLVSGTCLLPTQKTFTINVKGGATKESAAVAAPSAAPAASVSPAGQSFKALADQFEVIGSTTGYMPKKSFLSWLSEAEKGGAVVDERDNVLFRVFHDYGLWLAMLLILPLGLMLNLTPCVLPMIPVNLAVIGAGAKDGKRGRGFALGLAYGIGMALAYGLLGVVVVLTGSQFGALNASGWFNGAVALVFVLLGLAMFDVFSIDFSRFRSGGVSNGMAKGKMAGAFLMGALSAILAGACVAPVLIWVLVLSADLYSSGNGTGLILPFMLGIGMALPWPILGAGLSKMPKPGMWMVRVRQLFGVLILGLAVYYGYVSYQQFRGVAPVEMSSGWTDDLMAGMEEGLKTGKPVFLDFWGISCKNCVMMDKEVFPQPEVKKALENYIPVKFLADDLSNPLVAEAVKHYDVKGFPTYIVLRPKTAK